MDIVGANELTTLQPLREELAATHALLELATARALAAEVRLENVVNATEDGSMWQAAISSEKEAERNFDASFFAAEVAGGLDEEAERPFDASFFAAEAAGGIDEEAERIFDASSFAAVAVAAAADEDGPAAAAEAEIDTRYFASYQHVGLHETMLRDEVRTGCYHAAIGLPALNLAGKVVLDVGCGTGVLSMLAAKAGASKVVGVDAAPGLVACARKAVAANGLESVVRLVHGRAEDLSFADLGLKEGEGKVDVILSEWMGHCLLFESMLPAVLACRDRFMVDPSKGGTMWPSHCGLFLEAWSDRTPTDFGLAPPNAASGGGGGAGPSQRRGGLWWREVQGRAGAGRLRWWKDVHGLDLSAFAPACLRAASFESVSPWQVTSSRSRVWGADLNRCKDADLDFEAAPFKVQLRGGPAMLDGFVVAFDVAFRPPASGAAAEEAGAASAAARAAAKAAGEVGAAHSAGAADAAANARASTARVVLSTGPADPATHWRQSLFLLDPRQAPPAPLAEGTVVRGAFAMQRNAANRRQYVATISWEVGGLSGTQKYDVST